MKLSELSPRWLSPNVFLFLCPHCQGIWLSCTNVVMSITQQFELFRQHCGEALAYSIVFCKPDMAWTFTGASFDSLSVTPSLDASKSGHWHGHITAGVCLP